jgi:hypothetical protein
VTFLHVQQRERLAGHGLLTAFLAAGYEKTHRVATVGF